MDAGRTQLRLSASTIEPMGKSSTSGFHIVSKPPGGVSILIGVGASKSPLALDTLTIGSIQAGGARRVSALGRELAVSADKQEACALIREVEAKKSWGRWRSP